MRLEEKLVSSNLQFDGNFLKLKVDKIILPNNKQTTREFIEHPGAACVLALDEDDNVLMVKQYRYPISRLTYEIPAGKLGDNEEPIKCAYREFEEETGYKANNLELIGVINPAPAYTTEAIYIYIATGLSDGIMNLDDDEFLVCEKINIKKVFNMIINNEITDVKTQIAVLKYMTMRDLKL